MAIDLTDALWMITKLVLGLDSMTTCIAMTRGYSAPGNAIELVQNFVFGGIIGGVIYSPDVTLLAYLIALTTWTALVFLAKLGAAKIPVINRFAFGRDRVIYRDRAFETKSLARTKTPVTKVVEEIVRSGVDLDQIDTISVTSAGGIEIKTMADSSFMFLTETADLPSELATDRERLTEKAKGAEVGFLFKDRVFFVPKADDSGTTVAFVPEKDFRPGAAANRSGRG